MVIFLLILVVMLASAGFVLRAGYHRVAHGKIGVQYSRFGRLRRDHFGPRAAGGSSRVSIGGPGYQAKVVRGNTPNIHLPFLTRIEDADQTYIPSGTIGLVEAKVGAIPPPGTYLAPFVECHYFQDGEAFLRNGGQLGRQLQVLSAGHYDVNPHIFNVITVDNLAQHPNLGLAEDGLREIEIAVGETGVVITHLGSGMDQDPAVVGKHIPGHSSFQAPWVFLDNGGQLGVQSESLTEGGRYAVNPWFAHVVKVPTRNLILEWSKATKSSTNLDVSLAEIELDVQGHTVRLDMKQTLRIPAEAAPRLVRRFGDKVRQGRNSERTPVQEFVEKELAARVSSYFRRISARYEILTFITKYDELSVELAREVRQALALNGIEAVATMLDHYEVTPDDFNGLRRSIALENHKVNSLKAVLANSKVSSEIEQIQIELEAARRRLELVQVKGLIELLGPSQVASERLLAELAKAGVPHTIVSGGNDDMASSIMQAIPFNQARDLLLSLAGESGRYFAPPEQRQAIESRETE
jgi:hypothetical protein